MICEQSQILNTLSSFAFIIAACALLLCKPRIASAYVLITLCALTGIGSAIFHSGLNIPGSSLLHGIPFFAFIVIYIFLLITHKRPNYKKLLAASGLFAVGLFLKSLDMTYCESLPGGTHFLWHILVATSVYILTREYIRANPILACVPKANE